MQLGGALGAWNQLSRPLEALIEQESSSNAIYSDSRDMLESPSCCNICDGLPCALLYESPFSCVSRKLSWNCNVLIRWCSIIWISTRVKSWQLTLTSPWTYRWHYRLSLHLTETSLVECFWVHMLLSQPSRLRMQFAFAQEHGPFFAMAFHMFLMLTIPTDRHTYELK